MKQGITLNQLAHELERQRLHKADFIVPADQLRHRCQGTGPQLELTLSGETRQYPLSRWASTQLAKVVDMPFAYYEKLREAGPELLDRNVNFWLQRPVPHQLEPHMLRVLDGRIRAVVSRRYRRFDHYKLVNMVLPVLQGLPGAYMESIELTERKLYLKCLARERQVDLGLGDLVQIGVVISNSEIGAGSLEVMPLLYRLACHNGAVVKDEKVRRVHVGRGIDPGEMFELYQDDTVEADETAFALKIRDAVIAAVSEAMLAKLADRLRRTRQIPITGDPVAAVRAMGYQLDMTEPERCGVMRCLIEGGELNAFGLLNAVTRFAQEVADYDRASELEVAGGVLLVQSEKEWRQITGAGTVEA